jgi:ATP-binding cassette subfamily B protein/subfamily B ATP-binding cassette protein MsbA
VWRQFRLFRYLGAHRRDVAVVLAMTGFGVGLEVLRPWPVKLLVDHVLAQSPPSGAGAGPLPWLPGAGSAHGLLAWVAAGTILIFFASTVIAMVQTRASVRLGQRMVYELGADLFLHLQRLSLLFHTRRAVGDTIARVTGDPYGLQTMVNGALLPLFQSLAMLAAMFVVMWRLEPTLTVLALGVVPFLGLAIRLLGKPMQERTRERRELEGQMMSVVHQALGALPVVQAFAREEAEHARFRDYATKTVTAYERSTRADMTFKLVVGLVTAVGSAGTMWLGAHYALEGRLSVGTILVFVSYLGSLYGPVNAIAYTAATLRYTAANAERVLEVLDTAPDVRDRPDARDVRLQGHVRFEGVRFGYEPERPVVADVTLEARPGEVVAVVGPTGAGKSSLVSLLVRFFDPWEGRITLDGHDIRDLRLRSLRQQVAVVLQDPFILPLTVAENIAYGRPAASLDDIRAAAAAANADEFIRRLPRGYDTVIGEHGATLSGGEKQRLAIARALVKDAPVLVLDEPTSALDARTESLLLDALDRLMKGRTTLVIAHRLSTIRHADQIVVLEHGRIVEHGRHDALIALGGLYSALHREQTTRHGHAGAGRRACG